MERLTLKRMADEMNEWYKANGHTVQYTIIGRKVLYVDYSVPARWPEYGRAPVYVADCGAEALRRKHALMKRGLIK